MFLQLRRVIALLLTLSMTLISLPASAADDTKRLITEKDIFQFNWTANPQISPDGSQVAFVKVTVNEKRDGYDTALWAVSTSGNNGDQPYRLTNGPRDGSPRWSPDGRRLAFSRVAEKDGKAQPSQIYILNFTGGEPWALTSLPKGAGSDEWAPETKWIAFNSSNTPADLAKE